MDQKVGRREVVPPPPPHLSKLIILKYKIIILNHRHEHRQDFNVYIKQYNTIQKQASLGLPWTLQEEKARGKPSNSLAKKKSYEPRLVKPE